MKNRWVKAGVLCLALAIANITGPRYIKQSRAADAATVYQTSDEAAKAFMNFLLVMSRASNTYGTSDIYDGGRGVLTIISDKSARKLQTDGVDAVISAMLSVMSQPVLETKSKATPDQKSAVVKVTPNYQAAREIACVREGTGWRVDLVATYASWFKLDDKQISDFVTVQKEQRRRASCQSNLKQIGLGLVQYAYDYDERYPPAKQWHDAIMPYLKDEQIFNCPSVPSGKNGYAMNWKLSKQNMSAIASTSMMVSFYESTTLKTNHSGDGHDMAFRHLEGANLGFVDGHVKWFVKKDDGKWLLSKFKFSQYE